jgi:ABC-type transport system involved in multi-copper enzyme maturation permease subunit
MDACMWLLIQSCNQWLRSHLAWSNSWQSWQERIGGFFVLAGAFALIKWGVRLSLWQQVSLWALLLAGTAVMLRRGWLKLFGPVLFYDLIRVGRRSRYIWLRVLYVGVLLAILLYTYLMWTWKYSWGYDADPSGNIPLQLMARFAEWLFFTFMIVQLVLTVVLTPAYVAGAIAEEKDRKTLEYLLATDLRNREIVLSKLVARLANLLLIVLAGLPVLSFVQFFGGVDPDLLLAGFAATGLLMASLAGISIFCSVHARKPRDAIILTYLIVVAYHGLSFLSLLFLIKEFSQAALGLLLGILTGLDAYLLPNTGLNLEMLSAGMAALADADYQPLVMARNGFNAGNLFLALYDLVDALDKNMTLADVLPDVLRNFAMFHGVIAVTTSAWAVLRLRRVGLKEASGGSAAQTWGTRLWGRPEVGTQPMLWKEIFAEPGVRFGWLGRSIIAMLIFLSLLPVAFILYFVFERGTRYGNALEDLGHAMNVYVRIVGTLVACLTLLAVAVRAAGCLSGERDRQTMDGLLTTPLDGAAILFAKWAGCLASVRWGWVWLGLIWLLGAMTGGMQVAAVPMLIGAWLVYAGFFACLGMWFSLVSRTTLRATMWTLLLTVFLGAGQWLVTLFCCILPLSFLTRYPGHDIEYIFKFQAGQTPPAVLFMFAFHGEMELRGQRDWENSMEMLGFSILGLGTWTVAGLALAALVNHRFQDMTLRQALRRPERVFVSRPVPVATVLEEVPIELIPEALPVEATDGEHVTKIPPAPP